MRIVGVTGGIATGKSTFTAALRDDGWSVIDADVIAKEILLPGRPAYYQVLNKLAPPDRPLLKPNSDEIDRDALGALVFRDAKARKKLNGITHPWIMYTMIKQILRCFLRGETICFLDVPLLFEAGIHRWCDKTIVIDWSLSSMKRLKRMVSHQPVVTKRCNCSD